MPSVRKRSADKLPAGKKRDERANVGRHGPLALLASLFALVVLLLLPAVASAGTLEASSSRLAVWPEYDDPRVLVIMEADLTEETELPATASFNIPKGAEIGMACEVDGGGGHACKAYKLEDKGDYQTLSYQVETQKKLFVEYYYEAFPATPGERQFQLDYRPAFPTANLEIEVQEPARSTGFAVEPDFAPGETDSNGLQYFNKQVSSPVVEEVLPVEISYSKPDAEPSVKASTQTGGGGGLGGAASTATSRNSLITIAAVIGFAALFFMGYRTFRPQPVGGGSRRGGRGRNQNVVRSSPAKPAGGRKSGKDRSSRGAFCIHCGSQIPAQAKFCSECGSERDG